MDHTNPEDSAAIPRPDDRTAPESDAASPGGFVEQALYSDDAQTSPATATSNDEPTPLSGEQQAFGRVEVPPPAAEPFGHPAPLEPSPFPDTPTDERTWHPGRLFPEYTQQTRRQPLPLYGYPIYDEPDPEPPQAPPRPRRWTIALLALLAGFAGALATFGLLKLTGALDAAEPTAASPATTVAATQPGVVEIREIITEGDASAVAIAVGQKVVPSIVTVEIGGDGPEEFTVFGSGSGVVVTVDGLIVTNHHVIEGSDQTRVVFQDGRIYEAEVVGSDPLTDLAVLRIEGADFTPVEFGETSQLSIGDRAIAVGNPLGLRGGASLTVGVVSAFNREVQVGVGDYLFGMLQTDAPITQGSSGGALVNGAGELIGITTAIGVSSAGAEGIGFAIPVELVERITDEIIATGGVRHAFLGVSLSDSFEAQPDGAVTPDGALITEFPVDESAAQAAGLQPGDRIIRYDDIDVLTRDDLINGIRRYRVGDIVEIEVIRNGQPLTLAITLGERPNGL